MSARSPVAPGIRRIPKYLSRAQLILLSGMCSAFCGRQVTHTDHRIWDVDNKRKQKTVIVVKSKERGARTKVLTCNYSPDGNLIGGGASFMSWNWYLSSPGLL